MGSLRLAVLAAVGCAFVYLGVWCFARPVALDLGSGVTHVVVAEKGGGIRWSHAYAATDHPGLFAGNVAVGLLLSYGFAGLGLLLLGVSARTAFGRRPWVVSDPARRLTTRFILSACGSLMAGLLFAAIFRSLVAFGFLS